MEIKARKNTTEKALEELGTLVKELSNSLHNDITTVSSPTFFCEADIADDGYWWVTNGEWCIKNGNIELMGWDDENGYFPTPVDITGRIRKINFHAAIEALENVIEKYNDLSEKKDQQIEKFLDFCAKFNA